MTPVDNNQVLTTVRDGIATVTLNRPASLNAINVPMLREFVDSLDHAQSQKAIVVTGAGRAFCTGEDLKQTLAPKTGNAQELKRSFELLQDITRIVTSAAVPVIAAVQGYAVGGGAEIALACDLVIVEPGARFKFPEVPLGHAHTGGITGRLPQLVGLMKAKELLLTGRWIESHEAVAMGLALEECSDAAGRAHQLASMLADQPQRSIAAAKRAIELSTFPTQETNLRLEVEAATYCFASEEAEAAFEDFKQRQGITAS